LVQYGPPNKITVVASKQYIASPKINVQFKSPGLSAKHYLKILEKRSLKSLLSDLDHKIDAIIEDPEYNPQPIEKFEKELEDELN
jgi:hypothetical protein